MSHYDDPQTTESLQFRAYTEDRPDARDFVTAFTAGDHKGTLTCLDDIPGVMEKWLEEWTDARPLLVEFLDEWGNVAVRKTYHRVTILTRCFERTCGDSGASLHATFAYEWVSREVNPRDTKQPTLRT